MAQIKQTTVPDIGGAHDVVVIEVLVKPGDAVTAETPVVTLESDKATMEVPAAFEGKVKQIEVKEGDKVNSGSTILTVEVSGGNVETSKESAPEKSAAKTITEEKVPKEAPGKESPPEKAPSKEKPIPQKAAPVEKTEETDEDVHAGPGVRRMARELGVNLSALSGSGPKNRVLKEDIDAYVKAKLSQMQSATASPAISLPVIDFSQFGAVENKPLSKIKKISGKYLQRNWSMIPHVTQFGEADITSLETFRQTQKEMLESQKIKLTPLTFIMKAVAASLKTFTHFNASLDPSGEQLIIKHYYHIGIAVDTPDGLVVPVIRDVDKKGLIELAQELALVSEKARNKQLTPLDMQGGSMSISSLGGIGGTAFTPIINFPEVAILGVSKSTYKPVYEQGTFVPRLMLPLSLSFDHRVIDGAEGARFMVHLTNMLSDIRNCLL